TALVAPASHLVLPSGTVRYNSDLLTEEPELVDTDPQTVVYKIRPTAQWADGTPISAKDYEYSWRVRTLRPAVPAAVPAEGDEPGAGYWLIDSVTAADNGRTVRVRFTSPMPDWRSLFNVLLPAHLGAATGDITTADGLLASRDAFTSWPEWTGGPYTVSASAPGRQVELVPNTAWYGAASPTLEKLVFRFYDDRDSAVAALERGELDALDLVPDRAAVTRVRALTRVGVGLHISASHDWTHLDLNSAGGYLSDRALRVAVLTAVGTTEIVEKAIRDFAPSATPRMARHLFPGQPGYRDVLSEVAPEQGSGRADSALDGLADAGYLVDGGRLHAASGEIVPPLRLRLAEGDPITGDAAELIRDQLDRIGLAVVIEPTPDLAATRASGDFDLILRDERDGPFLAPTVARWRGAVADDSAAWHNADSAALLERAAIELDEGKRRAILNRQDELMTAAAVVLPLYQRPRLLAVAGGCVNIRANPSGGVLTYNAQQWGLP
ncbi:MAG: ABC transporter family substrate-binding protein, partial [Dactylosporangium sp.]|nr:ABC transporter family substrate-binding protein [Dactylosporangium sp.]NNJ60239.1 ABC transporter family substrate-binding protein [Dactylosporangium sp.]